MVADNTRTRVYGLLEGPVEGRAERWVRGSIQVLIVLNVVAVILETVEPWGTQYAEAFTTFEIASIAIFSVEYALRLWVCTADIRYRQPFMGRLRYAVTPMAVVDLLAILPAYFPLLLGSDLRIVRALRLLRVFRVLKLGRHAQAVNRIGAALRETSAEIGVVLFAALILLVLASAALYSAENAVQPDVFTSIPASAWCAISTLTPIGSGTMSPLTPLGRLAAGSIAVLGVGVFAAPAGLLASAFLKGTKRPERCPHCGRELL